MKQSFNLKKCIKQAFYDDARGYMQTQSRAWMNCYKQKSDQKKGPQEVWNSCMEEYQKAEDKSKWLTNYGADNDKVTPRLDAKTPAAQKIAKSASVQDKESQQIEVMAKSINSGEHRGAMKNLGLEKLSPQFLGILLDKVADKHARLFIHKSMSDITGKPMTREQIEQALNEINDGTWNG